VTFSPETSRLTSRFSSAPIQRFRCVKNKRLEKNTEKLFTSLDHDDVPWNNNTAEHAIKAIARRRRVLGGKSTEKGIQEYLIFLSVCETWRYRGIIFGISYVLGAKTLMNM